MNTQNVPIRSVGNVNKISDIIIKTLVITDQRRYREPKGAGSKYIHRLASSHTFFLIFRFPSSSVIGPSFSYCSSRIFLYDT
jgi:hypothetical protein